MYYVVAEQLTCLHKKNVYLSVSIDKYQEYLTLNTYIHFYPYIYIVICLFPKMLKLLTDSINMDDSTKVLAYLGVSAAVKLGGTILTYGQKPNNLERVGHISKVTLFPGKSMRGIDLDNGTCTKIGLRHPKYDIDDR